MRRWDCKEALPIERRHLERAWEERTLVERGNGKRWVGVGGGVGKRGRGDREEGEGLRSCVICPQGVFCKSSSTSPFLGASHTLCRLPERTPKDRPCFPSISSLAHQAQRRCDSACFDASSFSGHIITARTMSECCSDSSSGTKEVSTKGACMTRAHFLNFEAVFSYF